MLVGQHSPSLSFKKAGSALIAFHKEAMIGKGVLDMVDTPAQLRALRKS
jgi:hypothetical protein